MVYFTLATYFKCHTPSGGLWWLPQQLLQCQLPVVVNSSLYVVSCKVSFLDFFLSFSCFKILFMIRPPLAQWLPLTGYDQQAAGSTPTLDGWGPAEPFLTYAASPGFLFLFLFLGAHSPIPLRPGGTFPPPLLPLGPSPLPLPRLSPKGPASAPGSCFRSLLLLPLWWSK